MRRLVLVVGLLAGCDDDSGSDIPLEGLGAAYLDAYCDLFVECGLIDDQATCHMLDASDLDIDPSIAAAVEAGKVIYHPENASACIAALRGIHCDRSAFGRDEPEACDKIFEGTVPANGVCALDEECISQDCVVPACPEACCQGTCVGDVAPIRPHVGEACTSTSASCVDSYCDFNSGLCATYLLDNSPCTQDRQCLSYACINSVCAQLSDTGESCTSSNDCRDLGDTCSGVSLTCVPFGLTGDPCSDAMPCSPIYACNTSGTCELAPTLGEACDPQMIGCLDYSYCDATTLVCTTPKSDGQPCQSSSECVGDCDFNSNTCVTPPVCF